MPEFSHGDSLGSLSNGEIAAYLTSIGDLNGADGFLNANVGGQHLFNGNKSYSPAGCVIGHIAEGNQGPQSAIANVGTLQADQSLVGQRIKITLDKFYVDNYPGLGRHNILCEFSGRNQVEGEVEPLKFVLRFQADDKDGASIMGVPLFLGLTVGPNGISFEGRTINVSSDKDEALLATLESPSFKSGLALLTTVQPALKPFSNLAEAAVKNVLKRSANKQVHSFNLGFDFSANVTSARLRLGSYVVVQRDGNLPWDWSEVEWDVGSQSLRYRDGIRSVEFNYMVFGVTRYIGD